MVRLAAATVVVMVVTLLLSGGLRPIPAGRTLTGVPPPSGILQPPAGPVAKIQPTSSPRRPTSAILRHRNAATHVASPEVPIQTIVIEVEPPAVPREADLRTTMSRGELIRKFGEPNMIASWSEVGKLYERLTYVDERTYTELLLWEGRLVWSYTEHH
jgi:hypothetical protein